MWEPIWINLDFNVIQKEWKNKQKFYVTQTEAKRKEIIENSLIEANIAQVKEDSGEKYQFEFSKWSIRTKDINQIIEHTTKIIESTGVNISNILNYPNEDMVRIDIDISNFQSN